MELWTRLTAYLWFLLNTYDDQTTFLLVLVEEIGLPLPLPGDLIMMLAGYRISQGEMNLVLTLASLETATLIGSSILYWLAKRGGRPLLYRYGPYLHADRAKLDRAEAFLQRRGLLAIVLGRIIPGLRIPTALAAGAFGVSYRRFLLGVAPGAFVYLTFFVILGMVVGPQAIEAITGPRFSLRLIATVALFLALTAVLVALYRRRSERPPGLVFPIREPRWEVAALAGLIATLEMAFGFDLLLYLLGAFGALQPEAAFRALLQVVANRTAATSLTRVIMFALVGLLLLNTGWAWLYVAVQRRWLPGSPVVQGLLFSVLPLAFSVGGLYPLLGAGPLGLGLGAGLLPFGLEVVRNALFGAGLGTSWALLESATSPAPHRARAAGSRVAESRPN